MVYVRGLRALFSVLLSIMYVIVYSIGVYENVMDRSATTGAELYCHLP